MSARWSKGIGSWLAGLMFLVAAGSLGNTAHGQAGGFFGGIVNRIVGGLHFDARGTLSAEQQTLDAQQLQSLKQELSRVDPSLSQRGLRFVSLKQINQALIELQQNGQAVPPELAFLGGIQRLEYVIVRPAENDVLLAGYGEGWRFNEQGFVVGETTGAPVLQLEDLLVAFRNVEAARSGNGISVSIDPTQEGVQRCQDLLNRMAQARQFDPAWAPQIEQAMGDNVITLSGIPAESRYAQVLAMADHKMKRLSMGLDPAPIKNFPSVLELLRQRDGKMASAPRFWMECNYEPIARSEDRLVWQLRGAGVKTMTDDQFFDHHGIRHATGRSNRFAETWADTMTERFEELAKAEPVFAELRNVMDMSVLAALIEQEGLLGAAKLEIPQVTQSESTVATPVWPTPKTIPAQCSYVAVEGYNNVFVSGGVLVDSFKAAGNVEVVAEVAAVGRKVSEVPGNKLWWNAND